MEDWEGGIVTKEWKKSFDLHAATKVDAYRNLRRLPNMAYVDCFRNGYILTSGYAGWLPERAK